MNDWYYRPFRGIALLTVAMLTLLADPQLRRGITQAIPIVALAFAVSRFPSLLVMPLLHYIGVSVVLLTVLIYVLVLSISIRPAMVVVELHRRVAGVCAESGGRS